MRISSFTLAAVFLLITFATYSQENLKIGHVNIPELIQQLPEKDSIQQVLKKEAEDMEKLFNEMLEEHDSNVRKFESEKNNYSEFVRNSKERDLMEMAAKIQQYQQNANQQLQKRNLELLKPVYDKINGAIEKVALNNNFTYILDLSNGTVAYHSPSSENLNPLVLELLGIIKH